MADFNNKSADRESTNVKSGADDEVRTDTEELHDDQVSIEDIVDFYKTLSSGGFCRYRRYFEYGKGN